MNMLDIETTTFDDVEYSILPMYHLFGGMIIINIIDQSREIHSSSRSAYCSIYDLLGRSK